MTMTNRPGLSLALTTLLIAGVSLSVQAADGKVLFDKNCAQCHSKDGTAQTPAAKKFGVKDLSQSKLTDAQIKTQIEAGTLDPARPTKMPAYQGKFSKEEIEALVSVVKTFRK